MKHTPFRGNSLFIGAAFLVIFILAFGLYFHAQTSVEPPNLVDSIIESASLNAPVSEQDSAAPPANPPQTVATKEDVTPFSVSPHLPEKGATPSPAIVPEIAPLPDSRSASIQQTKPAAAPPRRTVGTPRPLPSPILAKAPFPALPTHSGFDALLPTKLNFGSPSNPLAATGSALWPTGEPTENSVPPPSSNITAIPGAQVNFLTVATSAPRLLFTPLELLDIEIECDEPLPAPDTAAFDAAVLPTITADPAIVLGIGPIVVFGDSLSDAGNLFLATTNSIPGPPYFDGSFSTGPVWPEILAEYLFRDPSPSLAGGSNYAVAGARTASHPSGPFGLEAQIATYLSAGADTNALHIVWIGGNDLRDALVTGDAASATAVVSNALATVAANLTALAATGSQNILVLGVPNLAVTPQVIEFNDPVTTTAAAGLSTLWNTQLRGITSLVPGASFIDIQAEVDTLIANASRLGITNTTERWIDNLDADPNSFLFTDDLHPTAPGHQFLANRLVSLLPTVAPNYAETNIFFRPGNTEVSETIIATDCAGETIERTYTNPDPNVERLGGTIVQRITRVNTTGPVFAPVEGQTITTFPLNDPQSLNGIGLVSTETTDPRFDPIPVLVPDFIEAATATDNCGGEVTITQFPLAIPRVTETTDIILTATDDCGNTSEAMTTLTLLPPTVETRIFGLKYDDVNNDGVRQCSGGACAEPGVDGVTMYLDLNRNDLLDADEPSVVTERGGRFEFPPVLPGRYRVAAVPATGASTAGASELVAGLSEIIAAFVGDVPEPPPPPPPPANGPENSPNILPLAVSGSVWQDLDSDGVFNEARTAENAIPGAVIRLESAIDNTVLQVATSNVDGTYSFDLVPMGAYRVVIDPETVLEKFRELPTTPFEVEVGPSGSATVDFGFLGVILAITLSDIHLTVHGLQWTTATEQNTLAFQVARLEADGTETPVHENPVLATGGGDYAVAFDASPGDIILLREITTDLESDIAARVGLATPTAGSGDIVTWDGTSQILTIDGPTLINGPPATAIDVSNPDAPIYLFGGELNAATYLDWSGSVQLD